MDKIKAGRLLFATGLLGMSVQHFLYSSFIAARAPAWPEGIPGEPIWAYFSGALLVATSISIATEKRGRSASLLTALIIFVWAVLRNIPLAVNDSYFGGVTTNAFKALAVFGSLLIVAMSLPDERGRLYSAFYKTKLEKNFIPAGRIMIGVFLFVSGIQHFVWAAFVQGLVPVWIPGALFWTYAAGVALLVGGAGLILNVKARLMAFLSGGMIFLWLIVLHLPRAIAAGNDANEWIAVCEATIFSGGLFVLAQSLKKQDR